MGVMVNAEPEVMSRAVTQAEDVKNILLFSSWSDPGVDGRSCCGSLTATTMTFFASFPFADSAEPVTTHPAPKGTCWKTTAGINKKAFSTVFFLGSSTVSEGGRMGGMEWEEGLRAAMGITVPQKSCRHHLQLI